MKNFSFFHFSKHYLIYSMCVSIQRIKLLMQLQPFFYQHLISVEMEYMQRIFLPYSLAFPMLISYIFSRNKNHGRHGHTQRDSLTQTKSTNKRPETVRKMATCSWSSVSSVLSAKRKYKNVRKKQQYSFYNYHCNRSIVRCRV